MHELVCDWEHEGRTITFTWLGDAVVTPSRVYALAFTPDGDMLLVSGAPEDPDRWLPGGGIEPGEAPEDALARELLEEAAATVLAHHPIGSQRVDDPVVGSEFHTFYWCRVTLADEYLPRHEVTQRHLVRPEDFLDALFWGRRDPKGAVLLTRALALEREHAVDAAPPTGRC